MPDEDQSVATEDESSEETVEVFDGDFDAERAKATITKQRQAEKDLKARLTVAEKAAEELAAIRKAEEDEKTTASEKLSKAESKIAELQSSIVEAAIKASFVEGAADRGYSDPGLAYLAAREQGLLGKADPKTGEVSGHDFDTLEETHSVFAQGGGRRPLGGGDGARRKPVGKTDSVNAQFNSVVRQALKR